MELVSSRNENVQPRSVFSAICGCMYSRLSLGVSKVPINITPQPREKIMCRLGADWLFLDIIALIIGNHQKGYGSVKDGDLIARAIDWTWWRFNRSALEARSHLTLPRVYETPSRTGTQGLLKFLKSVETSLSLFGCSLMSWTIPIIAKLLPWRDQDLPSTSWRQSRLANHQIILYITLDPKR